MQDQEDEMCNVMNDIDIGSEMREEITKQKQKSEQKNTEMQSSKVETKKEMDEIIQNYKRGISSRNAISIVGYHSRNAKFRDGFNEVRYPCPQFLIKKDQILDMFGGLQIQRNNESDEQSCTLTSVETPFVLNIIKSPYPKIHCFGELHVMETQYKLVETITQSFNWTEMDPF